MFERKDFVIIQWIGYYSKTELWLVDKPEPVENSVHDLIIRLTYIVGHFLKLSKFSNYKFSEKNPLNFFYFEENEFQICLRLTEIFQKTFSKLQISTEFS